MEPRLRFTDITIIILTQVLVSTLVITTDGTNHMPEITITEDMNLIIIAAGVSQSE